MPNNQTKAITHGAMMIALFLVLIALAFYIPIVNIIALIFAPLPLAWYSATYERGISITISFLAVMSSIVIGSIMILPFAFILGLAGLVVGDCLRQKKSKVFLLMATGIAILFAFAIQFLVMTRFFELNFIDEGMKLARESYEESLEYSAKVMGRAVPTEQLTQTFDMMQTILPASITIMVFTLAIIIVAVNLPILKRLGVQVPQFALFRDMRLPRAVLWYYLIVLSINLFMQPEVGTTLYVVMMNLSIVLWVLLTLQGISFIHFAIDTFNYPTYLKVLATLLAIPLYSFVVLIGILDLGFNLRDWVRAKSKN